MFHWRVLIVTVRACAPLLLYSRSHNQNLSPVSTDSDWTARPWSVSTSTGCVKVTPLLCHQRTLVLCAQFVLHEWHCERMGCESANMHNVSPPDFSTKINSFTFTHLSDAFIQSDLQNIQSIHFLSVCVFPGNWTRHLCAANVMLYHRNTSSSFTHQALFSSFWTCKGRKL